MMCESEAMDALSIDDVISCLRCPLSSENVFHPLLVNIKMKMK
jgi:hypothetical protein